MILDRLARRSVDVDGGDLVPGRGYVIAQTHRELVDGLDLGSVLRRDDGFDVPPVALHDLELRSTWAK